MKNSKETFWKEKFQEIGAFWKHDGNPLRPHALLTSGNHSDGFFNGSKVIMDPILLENACKDVLVGFSCPAEGFAWVIGSANGATTIPHEIAKRLGAKTGFTEKVETVHGKEMHLKRFNVKEGDLVLPVEDVLTTGGTTLKTIRAIEERKAKVFHKFIVLMNRSGMTHLEGREIVALIDESMFIWTPGECPLCKLGSVAVRPKENWDLLNAMY